MLLKMAIYQRLKGQHSPATWFKEAKLNEAMQWLGRGYLPSRRAWYDFRDRVGDAVEQLHRQLINRAIEQNLLDPTTGVQDGTFVAACASRHRMVSEQTLHKRQEQPLNQRRLAVRFWHFLKSLKSLGVLRRIRSVDFPTHRTHGGISGERQSTTPIGPTQEADCTTTGAKATRQLFAAGDGRGQRGV